MLLVSSFERAVEISGPRSVEKRATGGYDPRSRSDGSCRTGFICTILVPMPRKTSKPGAIHLRIVEVMKRFPGGITGGQIRQELAKEGLGQEEQTHLDRRKRDLKNWFLIEKTRRLVDLEGKTRFVTLYKYLGEREEVTDEGPPDQKTRAQIIRTAHGRCQMCGRSVERHGIALVVDHRKPREWGGTNDVENLWAVCEECNAGKKAYFSSVSVSAGTMKHVLAHDSVHVRIGEMLKASGVGNRTPSSVLEIVADQDDWHKRLRELRYPVIGWEIEMHRYKGPAGRPQVDYILRSYKPWPEDPSGEIRRFEKARQSGLP